MLASNQAPELKICVGDALHWLRQMSSDCVHCTITSPPYFGLRDYGADGQIGLEKTFEEYLGKLVEVFREVRRVLRPDGTLWLNMGDSYAGGGCGARDAERWPKQSRNDHMATHAKNGLGLATKNLLGIPWRLAFALQADGWYLRQDIIWSKPNPMPESVKDRCTKAHEYMFLLSKSERYWFDADAIKEPAVGVSEHDLTGCGYSPPGQTSQNGNRSWKGSTFDGPRDLARHPDVGQNRGRASGNKSHKAVTEYESSESEEHRTKAGLLKISGTAYNKRNKRSVWSIAPEPFKEAHFATFPTKLVEPCMLAGSPIGGVVLDPFGGSGTVGVVAKRLGRRCVLMELNPGYAEMAQKRVNASVF